MPPFKTYKKQFGRAKSLGETVKITAHKISEDTWWDDPNAVVGYLYDWYVDDNKRGLNNLHPERDKKKIPIDIKFIVSSSQTYSKDPITYHIMMKPSQECNVDYYGERFAKRYFATFPCGLYIDLPDYKGQYNRWLVVAGANINDPQYPTYEVLRCDYVFQWISKGVKHNMAGVLRSQNSYNSGVWTDFKLTSIEDQQKFIVPLNRDSESIFYNTRMIVDAPVITEPRTWVVTKVNRISANGLLHTTLAQDLFDQHTDYIEVDEDGNVTGMWADYYREVVEPMPEGIFRPIEHVIHSKIAFSGVKPEIKIGGSYKKLTVHFYDEFDNEIEYQNSTWKYEIDGVDVSDKVSILDSTTSTDVEENQVKVKFIGDYSYVGKVLVVTNTADTCTSKLEIGIISL